LSSSVSPAVWLVTAAILVAMVAVDLVVMSRRSSPITLASSMRWVALYVGLAVAFGIGLVVVDRQAGSEFFAGYLTEYSLSVDNLFVFMLIMAKFQVPVSAQDRALLIGIVLSLFMRAVLIAGGTALVAAASWAFYIFGALLRRVVPLSMEYDGAKLRTRIDGRRVWTPLMIVVASIALANVLFALDSIPAILGLTQDTFVILTANAFALLGLRQLFFVVEGLLSRLVHLKYGLAVVLAFIGVKLITEGLHGGHVDRIARLEVPHISTWFSLAVIGGALAVAALTSMTVSGSGDPIPDD
jgi:predicted tellurium resistance membrane protein TerC